ncbi:MAG: T9SS type A sorting domain-containing protein [Fluviicola sp.]
MRKSILSLSALLISLTGISQVPNHHWTNAANGGSSAIGYCITTDEFGNVYAAGVFGSTTDFDPSAGVSNLTSNGALDVYLVKTNPQGEFMWAKNFGGSNDDIPSEIVISQTGNVYLTGIFAGSADFNPDAGVSNLTSVGLSDVFVVKVNSDGQFTWAKSVGSTNNDEGNGIDIDDFNESVFVIGSFSGTIDLDPGIGTQNVTTVGSTDVFMLKLNASGDYVASRTVGSISADRGEDIVINESSGDQYMTGFLGGTADFDPSGTVNELIGSNDIFLWKLTETNDYIYAKKMGGIAVDEGRNIDLDGSGNVYINGSFISTCNFDPNGGTLNITSNGSDDVFVAKLTPAGDLTWVKTFGSTGTEDFMEMDVTTFGNIYITGEMADNMDGNPDAVGVNMLTKLGAEDAYIVSLAFDGSFNWATSYGSTVLGAYTRGFGIHSDDNMNVYATGSFNSTVDFDPSVDANNISAVSGTDIYYQKLGPGFNGIEDQQNSSSISICPNPSAGVFVLNSDLVLHNVEITITNLRGEIIQKVSNVSVQNTIIDLENKSNGVYFIEIVADNFREIKKVIKE